MGVNTPNDVFPTLKESRIERLLAEKKRTYESNHKVVGSFGYCCLFVRQRPTGGQSSRLRTLHRGIRMVHLVR
jgi:hypothetical protein